MIRVFLCTILFFAMLESVLAGYVPRAFEGEFVQTKKSIISGSLVSNITLKYQFRGNVYMKAAGDNDETIYVCNPKKVWIYVPPLFEGEKGEVKIGNSSQYCLSKIFDKLNQGLKSNNDYSVKKLKGNIYLLEFSKVNEKKLGYQKFELVFKDSSAKFSDLKLMRMYSRNDKNPTVLTKKLLKVSKGFPRGTFHFNPPKNTNTTYL